jgi:hypothetical protein
VTLSSLDELRQIRAEIRLCNSLDAVRRNFDRLQEIRRQHLDDFDLQIVIADAHQEIIERARFLRKQAETPASEAVTQPALPTIPAVAKPPEPVVQKPITPAPEKDPEAAEIPADVPRLDKRSWQMAVGLAVLFTVGFLALAFYLIQAARRTNFPPEEAQQQPQVAAPAVAKPVVETPAPVAKLSPTVRLFTDLVAGTATLDDQPAKDLADGELDLDALSSGAHNVTVESRAGSAAFSFALDGDKDVPRVTQVEKSNNAMVVLVSVKDGTGRLHTDAAGAHVSLDGKPAGDVGPDGLLLLDLGNQDHDLEVIQGTDKQKFVLTYTAAPTLTVFVKSDPSTGVLTVSTGLDGVSVFINDLLYKRLTEHGGIRIPLKVGSYRIRVHSAGFVDPPESLVVVKKSAESAVQFHLQPAPALDVATLQIKGAQPGTVAYLDRLISATVGADGTANIANIKPGDHAIELHHDQAVMKQLTRTFTAGQTVVLTGSDVLLDHLAADNKSIIPAAPGPPVIPPPQVPQLQPAALPAATGEQVHKGGGFIAYHTPKLPGRYYFQAHAKLGGLLKHGKLEWYAGYQDPENYVLFSLDGKHAEVKEVRDGKPTDLGKIPFSLGSDEWVQIEMSVKADTLQVRAKASLSDWTPLTPVTTSTGDFTKQSVGLYVPPNEEVAVANFRFATK